MDSEEKGIHFAWYGETIDGTHDECASQLDALAAKESIDQEELDDALKFVRHAKSFGMEKATEIRHSRMRAQAEGEIAALAHKYRQQCAYDPAIKMAGVSLVLFALGALLVSVGIAWKLIVALL